MLCWWCQNLFGVCFLYCFRVFVFFLRGCFFVRCFRVSFVFFFGCFFGCCCFCVCCFRFFCVFWGFSAVSSGIVVFLYCFHVLSGVFFTVSVACCFCVFFWGAFVCFFGGVVYLSFRGGLWLLFLRGSLRVVLALLFVNYVVGFLAFCRIYI